MEPTKEELKAINSLKRLAKKWPKSLWLFSNGMGISIMRCGPDGGQATNEYGGMDQDYILDSVNIPNDGGDW